MLDERDEIMQELGDEFMENFMKERDIDDKHNEEENVNEETPQEETLDEQPEETETNDEHEEPHEEEPNQQVIRVKWRGNEVEIPLDDQEKVAKLLSKGLEMDEYKKEHAKDVKLMEIIRQDEELYEAVNHLLNAKLSSKNLKEAIKELLGEDEHEETNIDDIQVKDNDYEALSKEIYNLKREQIYNDFEKQLTQEEIDVANGLITKYLETIPGLTEALSDLDREKAFLENIIYEAKSIVAQQQQMPTNQEFNDAQKASKKKEVIGNIPTSGTRPNIKKQFTKKDLLNMSKKELEELLEQIENQ